MRKFLSYFQMSSQELFVLPIVSLLLLVGNSIRLIISTITGTVTVTPVLDNDIRTRFSNLFDQISDASVTTDITTILLWTLIGACIYMFITFVISLFSEATFSLTSEITLVHQKSYKRGEVLLQFITRFSFKLIFIIACFFYTGALIGALWPFFAQQFVYFVLDPLSIEGLVNVLVAVFGLIASLHVGVVLVRLLMLRPRL